MADGLTVAAYLGLADGPAIVLADGDDLRLTVLGGEVPVTAVADARAQPVTVVSRGHHLADGRVVPERRCRAHCDTETQCSQHALIEMWGS